MARPMPAQVMGLVFGLARAAGGVVRGTPLLAPVTTKRFAKTIPRYFFHVASGRFTGHARGKSRQNRYCSMHAVVTPGAASL